MRVCRPCTGYFRSCWAVSHDCRTHHPQVLSLTSKAVVVWLWVVVQIPKVIYYLLEGFPYVHMFTLAVVSVITTLRIK